MWCAPLSVRFWLPVAAGLAVAMVAPASGLAKPVVTDLRVGPKAAETRVVLDFNEPVEFQVFTLTDPDRVVIDLPEVGWRLPPRPLPRRIGLLERLRYGLFRKGKSRLVLDTTGPASVKQAFLLKPEGTVLYRLVVDLVAGRTTAPVAGAPGRGAATAPGVRTAGPAIGLPPRKPAPRGTQRVIVIDPGHGGVDPGTIGISGVYEKHLTLAAARAIAARLRRGGRYRVVLTRKRDVFRRLRHRVRLARDAGAALFLSLHADATPDRKTRGASVYTLSENASDKEAAALAEKENKADVIAGVDLSRESPVVTDILIDLAQRETMNQSARFAARLVKELGRKTRLLRNTHRFAGFAVLKAPDVPSVLIELGFLSNRHDERALRSKAHRAKLAAAVGRAVDAYFARVEETARR